MHSLVNSEDPDEITHNAAFHDKNNFQQKKYSFILKL